MLVYVSAENSKLLCNQTYQISLPRCQSLHGYYDQEEKDRQYRKPLCRARLQKRILARNPYLYRFSGGNTHDNSVIPGENGELIQSSDQIPPGSNVAGYEDPKGEDRKGVHESAAIVGALLFSDPAHLGNSMAGRVTRLHGA